MQFQYLGTGAAEGIPAVFCNCQICKEAAKKGGRDIRTRSQAMINDDLLIDLPPDTYMHKLQHGLDLTKVRYLLVTHMHMDHFYPQELTIRGSGYSHDMVSEYLDIYCAKETRDFYFSAAAWEASPDTNRTLNWHVLTPFEPVQFGSYTIVPLPASHMHEGNQPFLYHITDADGKQVLYLHDSGYYKDEVWDYLKALKTPVDLVSYDGTSGAQETDHGHHMGFSEVFRVHSRMLEEGIVDGHTKCVLNHFSHNGRLMYEDMVKLAEAENMLVSYDGMKLNI